MRPRRHYDVIIIDAPPVLLLADSVFLGRFADISLLVANWNETPRATVAEAVHRLTENSSARRWHRADRGGLGSYSSFATGDRTYYLSNIRTLPSAPQYPAADGTEYGE